MLTHVVNLIKRRSGQRRLIMIPAKSTGRATASNKTESLLATGPAWGINAFSGAARTWASPGILAFFIFSLSSAASWPLLGKGASRHISTLETPAVRSASTRISAAIRVSLPGL
jgi:hypothetical protein